MAPSRDFLLLLIDVSPKMHAVLPQVEKHCTMRLQKKLFFHKNDEVGIICFGTEETKNVLAKEVGGYEHIAVQRTMKVVNRDLVDVVQELPYGTASADFLDAIIVGMDMLTKRYGPTNMWKKRLCLITNALSRQRDPTEGIKEDQVKTVAAQMANFGVRLECIIVRGKLCADADKSIMDENDRLLDILIKSSRGKTEYVGSPTSLLGVDMSRHVVHATVFRGYLEVSSTLKIKIWVFKKTGKEKLPTLKKRSDKAPATDGCATHGVKVKHAYKSTQDPSKVIPLNQRIKGYRYGPEIVPISPDTWEAAKFKPEKGVKLLGFTDAKNVLRHYYMKEVRIFTAARGEREHQIAISALARAMEQTNKVAIVRCVWRQGQTNVEIGVLTPNVSTKDKTPDSFYYNVLPFCEDRREFQFPSFQNLPANLQPTEEQQEATDNLVRMLSLAPPGKEESLKPELTPNPVHVRFYHFLALKAKNPDAAMPAVDDALKRLWEPDPEFLYEHKSVIDEFRRCFQEETMQEKIPSMSQSEKPSGSNAGMKYAGKAHVEEPLKATETISTVKVEKGHEEPGSSMENRPRMVEKIGDLNPIKDFIAMLSRGDDSDCTYKAITCMKSKILALIRDSSEGDKYEKAAKCLFALRRVCVLAQEPELFNNYLHYLCKFCRELNLDSLDSFIQLIASKGMSLITKSESPESDVTDEAGRSFLDV